MIQNLWAAYRSAERRLYAGVGGAYFFLPRKPLHTVHAVPTQRTRSASFGTKLISKTPKPTGVASSHVKVVVTERFLLARGPGKSLLDFLECFFRRLTYRDPQDCTPEPKMLQPRNQVNSTKIILQMHENFIFPTFVKT